jgi:hypothetical protein
VFAIYSRCRSALRLALGESIRVAHPSGLLPWIDIRTRYLAPPAEHVALDLLIEVRLRAQGLEEAVNEGLQAAHSQLLPLTVAANAYVEDPVLITAYRVDAGVDERDWILRYQPPEHPVPPNTREIAKDAAAALIAASEHHPSRRRFGRVLAFYREALRYAQTASVLLAVEYLHVAAETLTPLLVEQVCWDLGIDKDQLRRRYGIEPSEKGDGVLLGQVRLHEIYGGDAELRHTVEQVSNGFEHGFEELDRVRELAAGVVREAGERVREALMRAAHLPPEQLTLLTGEDFSVPMPLFNSEYLYVGKMRVSDERLLAPGSPPVQGLRDWTPRVISSSRQADGRLLVRTGGDARGPEEGTSVTLEKAVQRMPVGLAPGAQVPEHRLMKVEVVEGTGAE